VADVDGVVGAAVAQTGLDDFGDDAFREGLEVLLASLRDEARLNARGEAYIYPRIVTALSQRLQVEDWYRRHPEIDDVDIQPPLVGLGLPRTGSTALSVLLAQDPAIRYLRRWESSQPCPPPSTVQGPDPRIPADEGNTVGSRSHVPTGTHAPMECLELMALDFKSHIFQAFAQIPSYSSWLVDKADLTSTYAYQRRVMRLLSWGEPARPWRLKSPSHVLSLDALNHVFPDARFVMTHRDVGKVLPSVCALYSTLSTVLTECPDPEAIGAHGCEVWRTALERLIDFRDRGNEGRFFDLAFDAVQRDPLDEVARLYVELGEDLSEEARRRMQAWWAESSKHRSGPGSYSPATFGLDPATIAEQFSFYYERFGISVSR